MDARFDRLDGQLCYMNSRIDGVDKRITNLSAKVFASNKISLLPSPAQQAMDGIDCKEDTGKDAKSSDEDCKPPY